MGNEIAHGIAEFLRNEGFDVHHNSGDSISIFCPGRQDRKYYINLIIWYNPTLTVSVNPSGAGRSIALIDMADPNSLDQISTAIKEWENKNGMG